MNNKLPNQTGSSVPQSSGGLPAPATGATPITVVLADDHNIVREGLRLLLEASGSIRVIGEAENGRQAVQKAKELRPDVLVLDLAMPILNGMEATRQIVKEAPDVKVLVLSSYSDDEKVQQLLSSGAIGYLVKQTAANDLLTAVHEAKKGNRFLSPAIARRLAETQRQTFANGGGAPPKKNRQELTPREAEVLQLIAEGFPNKQIAAELSISIKTVEKHRQQVMNKLNLHDIAGLTRHALSHGIIEPK